MRRRDSPLALFATAVLLGTLAAGALADAARWVAERLPWP
jgi:hypothetical protein